MDSLSLDFDLISVEWRVAIAAPSAVHRRQIADMVARYPMRIHVDEIGIGTDILPALTENGYNVAFLDVGFAELHGLDALRKAREQGSSTFVTLIADRTDTEIIDIAKALRAYDYLARPLNSMLIFKTLDTYAQISRPLKVMIVDNSTTIRSLVKRVIKHSVFRTEIIEAGDGVTAFELYARHVPDMVFLDLNMPGLSGRDTWRMLRAHHKHARVVMMSSEPVNPAEFGHAQCLAKPFSALQVDSIMHKLLGLSEPFSDQNDCLQA